MSKDTEERDFIQEALDEIATDDTDIALVYVLIDIAKSLRRKDIVG